MAANIEAVPGSKIAWFLRVGLDAIDPYSSWTWSAVISDEGNFVAKIWLSCRAPNKDEARDIVLQLSEMGFTKVIWERGHRKSHSMKLRPEKYLANHS